MFIPQENHDRIMRAIETLLDSPGTKRIDVSLDRGMTAKVYWAGKVIRIDIEDYKE